MADFDREDIGYLTKPVDMPKWISQVQTRSPFLRDLTPDELRWGARNARDRYEVADPQRSQRRPSGRYPIRGARGVIRCGRRCVIPPTHVTSGSAQTFAPTSTTS